MRVMAKKLAAAMLAVALGSACGQQATRPPTIPTPTGSVTDVEGNVYPTIKIGHQEWMVENLRTVTYNDGTPIPNVTDGPAWSKLASDAYSWYDNDVANKDVYGALYNWYAVDKKKLCPAGWSIPSSDSWGVLANSLGGKAVSGGRMKEMGTTRWDPPNTGATNASGFSARPAGSRYLDGGFVYKGQFAFWWCSDQKLLSLPATSWFWDVTSTTADSGGAQSQWPMGYSVRCLRAAD
jgi:uncharacterized protein (TIGR02145 family)